MNNKEKIYRAIALDLLKLYVDAEESVISEYSGDFYRDRLRLEKEVKHYLNKLDAEERYSDITNGLWIFEVEG